MRVAGASPRRRPRERDVDAHNDPRAGPAAVHQQIGPRPGDAYPVAGDEHLAAAADMVDSSDLGPLAIKQRAGSSRVRTKALRTKIMELEIHKVGVIGADQMGNGTSRRPAGVFHTKTQK